MFLDGTSPAKDSRAKGRPTPETAGQESGWWGVGVGGWGGGVWGGGGVGWGGVGGGVSDTISSTPTETKSRQMTALEA